MHGVGRIADHCAFGDEEGVLTVGTAAERKDGVAGGETGVSWDDGVDAKSYSLCKPLLVDKGW
jgi:hypothetical protein